MSLFDKHVQTYILEISVQILYARHKSGHVKGMEDPPSSIIGDAFSKLLSILSFIGFGLRCASVNCSVAPVILCHVE